MAILMQDLFNAISKIEIDFYEEVIRDEEEKEGDFEIFVKMMEEMDKQHYQMVKSLGFTGDYEYYQKVILDIRSR